MKFLFRSAVLGMILAAAHILPAQQPKSPPPPTLAEVVAAWKWDAATSGPLLVVGAAKTRASSGRKDLAAFARQQVKVGQLTAVVPTEMVVIDDSFRQTGSLTDGLPMDAKVLYLLTLLDKTQWKAVVGKGIGLSDLQGEPRAVFESLLPKKLKWRVDRVIKNGEELEPVKKGDLTEKEILGMKLRVAMDLRFEPNLLENADAYTVRETDDYLGKPGDLRLSREWWDDEDSESFGINVRQTMPNAAKPSQLAYADAAFEPEVRLAGLKTVKDALAAIGRATGREIYADVRVADLPLTLAGETAAARDLLKALALAVTGTYRQVGSAYVLTSDLMGAGPRKLRFALWWEELANRTHDFRTEWKRKIGDRVDQANFDAGSPFVPNERMKEYLESREGHARRTPIQAEDLTPSVRNYLEYLNRRMPHQKIQTNQVVIGSSLRFGFVLGDGRRFPMEHRALGDRLEFQAQPPYTPRIVTPPSLPVPLPAAKDGTGIAFRVETAGNAKSAVDLAHARGFREVWIETRSVPALKAAAEAAEKYGLVLKLVVRPWSTPTQDPDRNSLGDVGSALPARLEGLATWQRNLEIFGNPTLSDYDRMSPADEGLGAAWSAYASLAQTPGVSGVIVVDSVTYGYEPDRNTLNEPSRAIAEVQTFGYSVSQRLAFLRLYGTDPLDIVGDHLITGPDLRQPFFLDDALRGMPSVYDGRDVPNPEVAANRKRWAEYRAKAGGRQITALLERLAKGTKVLVNIGDASMRKMPLEGSILAVWVPGQPLPSFKSFGGGPGSASALLSIPARTDSQRAAEFAQIMKMTAFPIAIDLRPYAPSAWSAVLDRWIKRPE